MRALPSRKCSAPKTPGGPYVVTLEITNMQAKPMTTYGAVSTPASSLPAGAIGIQPQPVGWHPLPVTLNQGDSTTITLDLPGLSGGEFVCFNLTFLDKGFEECCTETVCVDIPKCECAIVHEMKVKCRQLADGTWVYDLDITLENTSHLIGAPLSAYGISFGPNVTAFNPNFIDVSGVRLIRGTSEPLLRPTPDLQAFFVSRSPCIAKETRNAASSIRFVLICPLAKETSLCPTAVF